MTLTAFLRHAPIAAAALLSLAAAPAPRAPKPAPPPAPAPTAPPLFPARDAIVGYHLAPASGEAINVGVLVRAGGGTMRVDLPDTSYVVASAVAHTLTMVIPLQQTTMELPWSAGPQALFSLDEHAHFTRTGEATVAKHKCILWEAVDGEERSTVCVTPDGLVLSRESLDPTGRRNHVEALAVRYEQLKEADFAIPGGFDHVPMAPGPRR